MGQPVRHHRPGDVFGQDEQNNSARRICATFGSSVRGSVSEGTRPWNRARAEGIDIQARMTRHDSRRGFVVAVVELQMGFGVASEDVKRRTYRQGGPDGGQGGDRERSSMGPRRLAILSSRSGPPENLSSRHSERWLRMPPIGALETCRVGYDPVVGGTGQHGCELITASPSDLRRESCPCPPEYACPISQCGSPSLGHAGQGTAVIRRTCSGLTHRSSRDQPRVSWWAWGSWLWCSWSWAWSVSAPIIFSIAIPPVVTNR